MWMSLTFRSLIRRSVCQISVAQFIFSLFEDLIGGRPLSTFSRSSKNILYAILCGCSSLWLTLVSKGWQKMSTADLLSCTQNSIAYFFSDECCMDATLTRNQFNHRIPILRRLWKQLRVNAGSVADCTYQRFPASRVHCDAHSRFTI